jgi:hypothetical protein
MTKWDDVGSLIDHFESNINGLSGSWVEKGRRKDALGFDLTKTFRFKTDAVGEYSVWGATNRKLFVAHYRFWTPNIFKTYPEKFPHYLAGNFNIKTNRGSISSTNLTEFLDAIKNIYWAHYLLKPSWPYG